MLMLLKITWDNMGHMGQPRIHRAKHVPYACPMFFEVGQTLTHHLEILQSLEGRGQGLDSGNAGTRPMSCSWRLER
jgi:hypothetical protein